MKNSIKLLLGITLLGLAALLLIGFLKSASIIGVFMIYPYLFEAVTGYGLNKYFAQAIAVVAAIVVWFGAFKWAFSWNKKNRYVGFGILAGVYVAHLIIMFALPGDALVHPTTGEPDFCTVDKITGRILAFEAQVFDKYGQKAEPCTAEQIERYEIEAQYGAEENPEVDIFTVSKGFISPATGQALFHYCADPAGRPKFFTLTGYCPWGGKLLPATADVVRVELSKAEGERELQAAEERKERAAKEHAENLKVLERQKREKREWAEKQAALKEKKAQVEFHDVRWGDIVSCGLFCLRYGVEFYAKETNHVSASLQSAILRIWRFEQGESPQSFKQRSPMVFEWRLNPRLNISGGAWYTREDSNYEKMKFAVDLGAYENFFKRDARSWLELTLFGADANGNKLEYNLQ